MVSSGAPVPGAGTSLITLRGRAGSLCGARSASPRPSRGTALFVPGYTGSMEDAFPIMDLVAERGYDIVTFSQRGQRGSDGPGGYGSTRSREGYRLDDFVGDLIDVVGQVSDRRVHLVGHSFGGVIGSAAVVARPDLFRSYTHWNSGPRSRFGHGYAVDAVTAGGSAGLWPSIVAPAELSESDREWLHTRLLSTRSDYLLGAAMILLEQDDIVDDLRGTGIPTLVSHGSLDDRWPIDWQADMAQRLGARYWVVADAGHGAQNDEPLASAELLVRFWAEVDRDPARQPPPSDVGAAL
ncbi:alpha/beta hydrolase [soil metagenome]